MNTLRKICIVTQDDLIEAGCFDIGGAIDACEKALINYFNGNIIFPDKISVIFDEKSQNRINCLPAGLMEQKIYGMKWVSVFPENPYKFGVPNLSAVILLSELETGYPVAFMEGTVCSNLRSASISAIGAKYLARKDSEVIGFIGAGEQAKTHMMTLLHVLPSLKRCKVASRTRKSEDIFISQMSKMYPNIEFVACNGDYEMSARNSDVIVTAISGQEKILQADWIGNGVFYCHVGGLEDDFAVPKKANKIVCDDWNVVKHRTQTISRMYAKRLLKDEDIYANLYEIVAQQKSGRENDKEFIYFNAVGLSYVDVMLANNMYMKVKAKGYGKSITMQHQSMFDIDSSKIFL